MIATLTRTERHLGLFLSVCLAILGLTMAALGKHDPMAVHGFIALALGLALVFPLGGVLEEPAPDPERLQRYYAHVHPEKSSGHVFDLVSRSCGLSAFCKAR
jgi:cytochrome c oxidase cbb3-type subunit 1